LAQALMGLGVEVVEWSALDPTVHQWLAFARVYGSVVLSIVVLLTIAEVLNTMLTAVLERRRELALMGALGVRGPQLFCLLLLETLTVTAAGAALGYGVGVGAVHWAASVGIDLSRFAEALQFFYMDPVIVPRIESGTALRILGAALVGGLLAGIYPAWKGARVDPAGASGRAAP
jgi:ABC-type antimicrobial peptide transport system permease subunit